LSDPCRLLDWDTEFFGLRVARVQGDLLTKAEADSVDGWCRANGIRCVYLLARADDPETRRLAEDHGYRLVDVRVTLEHRLDGRLVVPERIAAMTGTIRPFSVDDLPSLEEMAGKAFYPMSRFNCDPHFPRERCDELYLLTVRQCGQGGADQLLVSEIGGEAAGFVSCHLENEGTIGRIGWQGVAESARRQGVGEALVWGACRWFEEQAVQHVVVSTQGTNIPARRQYVRAGFLPLSLELWYHKWFEERGS